MSMKGPCLCGDPSCPSCGNPAQAAYEEAVDLMVERINDLAMDEYELALFEKVGVQVVKNFRETVTNMLCNKLSADHQYTDYLEEKIKALEEKPR